MVLSMDKYKGKVAVVTGASSGMGAAIAQKLVEEGLIVVGIARRKEIIEQNALKLASKPGKLYAVKADMTNEDDILQAFKWVKENVGPIHVLLNCAGVQPETTLIDGEIKKWRLFLDTKVMGYSIATREAVRNMRANNVDGQIIHINSIESHYVPDQPNLAVSPAVAHAIDALTDTLRLELISINSKIRVSSISPGCVDTDLFKKNDDVDDLPKILGDFFKISPKLDQEDIVDAVVYILSTPPHVQIRQLTIKPVGETF